jgi:glutaredoxin
MKKAIMKKVIVIGSLVLLVAILITGIFLFKNKNLSADQAKTRAENFINSYLVQQGYKATVSSVTKVYDLYKMTVTIGSNQSVDSYMSQDGKLFFPQALDIDSISNKQAATATTTTTDNTANAAPTTVLPKNSKPKVELFVMSYCPYGTQMEKGILPVVKALGNKIDFQLKFCDYSMHGDKELQENLTQYCIQQDYASKFNDYLSCFLGNGQSASCQDSLNIDKTKIASCVSTTDKKYKVTENATNKVDYSGSFPGFNIYKADNIKYNVAGSPTLIINGKEANTNRDSASLLTTICSAFNNQPAECQDKLSSAAPTPGFGNGASAGSANSGAAGCAQ